ncbi:MAG: ATP-binding protein [Saprospiraceae bacterium]
MIERSILPKLQEQCFQGKAIILLGARQVGKTTLLKSLVQKVQLPHLWLNADEADIFQELVEANTSSRLKQIFGQYKLIIIDEAQQVPEMGKKMKLIQDTFPDIQLIATGSSAFELQQTMNEPLTGRKREFHLYPFSFEELINNSSLLEEKRLLQTRLVYGSYPEVVNNPGKEQEALLELANSYLYKDLLQLDGIRKTSQIEKLLQALAFQLGQEVNFNELSKTIGNISTATVEKYIGLLEKAFVIYRLPALNRNFRNEIKKGKKYYFYDNGIRNVLISNLKNTSLRNDIGSLWENYFITERLKFLTYDRTFYKSYFWRTQDQAEIDYIEERDGVLHAYEIKWKAQKVRFPNSFLSSYPNSKTQVISPENFDSFLM